MAKGKLHEYRAHLVHLADEHEVSLTWTTAWDKAMAYPDLYEAVVPCVRGAGDYLVGLHELGHILDPEARRFGVREDDLHQALLCEGAAWAWAAMEALPVPKAAWARVADSLLSYLVLPQHHRPVPNPPPPFTGPVRTFSS